MKKIFFTLAFLLVATPLFAQNKTLEYMYVATSLTEVNTYTQVVSVNNSVVTTPATCVTKGTDVVCTVPIVTNPGGSNTISVQAILNGQVAETVINYNPTAPGPKQPSNGKIKIVIIINVP